jgi:hypothetical protein
MWRVNGFGSALLLFATACVSTPPAPPPGKAQIWGRLQARPPVGAETAPLVDAANSSTYGATQPTSTALPSGSCLVDYRVITPAFVEAIGPTQPASEARLVEATPQGFAPAFTAMAAGATLTLRNTTNDPLTLVILRDGERIHELELTAGAQSPPLPTGSAGWIEIACYERDDAPARIRLCAGAFALVAADGRFTLDALEPGTYQLEAWHPRFPPQRAALTVTADEQRQLDLWFALDTLPKVESVR